MREPAQVAPGRAVLEVELELFHLEAGTDGVDGHPRLDPEAHRDGNTAERARAVRWRCPESGSRGASPQRSLIIERAADFASPRPPPTRAANAAIVSSASDSTSCRRSPRRSASHSRSGPGSSCRSASVSACPLPRRGELDHAGAGLLRALGGRIAGAVVGHDDRRPRGTARGGPPTVRPILPSSSRAATSTVSRSGDRSLAGSFTPAAGRKGSRAAPRRWPFPRRRSCPARRRRGAGRARAGRQRCRPSRRSRGQRRERGNGAGRGIRGFGAHSGHARSCEAAVQAGEK